MIITVANHKGGVGKTALAAHLLFAAAESGKRALGIDFDRQGNLCGIFVDRDTVSIDHTAIELFNPAAVVTGIATSVDNVAIVAANTNLEDVDKGSLSTMFHGIKALKALGAMYDVIVIDTPPNVGLRVQAALAASQMVVAPLQPEKFATDGLEQLLQEISSIRSNLNHTLEEPAFVLNLVVGSAKTHTELSAELRKALPRMLGPLHRRIAVVEAMYQSVPVWKTKKDPTAGEEWKTVCSQILNGAP